MLTFRRSTDAAEQRILASTSFKDLCLRLGMPRMVSLHVCHVITERAQVDGFNEMCMEGSNPSFLQSVSRGEDHASGSAGGFGYLTKPWASMMGPTSCSGITAIMRETS